MSIFKINIKAGTPAVFDPSPITVYVNDNVYWFNSDPKNAHWPAPSAANPQGFLEYQVPPNNSSNQVAFGAAQKISYICVNHPGEKGQIIVKPGKKMAFGSKTKKGAFAYTTYRPRPGKGKKGAFGLKTR